MARILFVLLPLAAAHLFWMIKSRDDLFCDPNMALDLYLEPARMQRVRMPRYIARDIVLYHMLLVGTERTSEHRRNRHRVPADSR